MIATCFALLFQSVLVSDALGEYMWFFRGILAIAIQMGIKQYGFLFKNLLGNKQVELIDVALKALPLIDSDAATRACRSLEKMGPLCKTKVEMEFYRLLLSMARSLFTSSREGMIALYDTFTY